MPGREKPMAGKTCMVTGATSGIGAATALSLAVQGATVFVVGRNRKKCSATVNKISCAAGTSSVHFMLADLSIQSEIRQLAARFKQNHQRLDVLINNAGARFSSRIETAEGHEMTFALNHLGYFLLTTLLLEVLKVAGNARIINVASGAHTACPGVNFKDLQSRSRYNGKEAYAQSKLANIMFTYELARRLEGTGLTVNALEPGNVASCFSRNNGWVSWTRHILGSLKTGKLVGPKVGAKTSIYLASSPDVEGVTGQYFSDGKAVRSSDASYDSEAWRRLWKMSLELTDFSGGLPAKLNDSLLSERLYLP